jgi:hypothetical protein
MHINANMIEGQLPQNLDEFQYQVGLWAKAPKQSSSESQFTVLGDCLQV